MEAVNTIFLKSLARLYKGNEPRFTFIEVDTSTTTIMRNQIKKGKNISGEFCIDSFKSLSRFVS